MDIANNLLEVSSNSTLQAEIAKRIAKIIVNFGMSQLDEKQNQVVQEITDNLIEFTKSGSNISQITSNKNIDNDFINELLFFYSKSQPIENIVRTIIADGNPNPYNITSSEVARRIIIENFAAVTITRNGLILNASKEIEIPFNKDKIEANNNIFRAMITLFQEFAELHLPQNQMFNSFANGKKQIQIPAPTTPAPTTLENLDENSEIEYQISRAKQALLFHNYNNNLDSIEDYSKSIEILPKIVSFYLKRGELYERENDFKKALGDFRRAKNEAQNFKIIGEAIARVNAKLTEEEKKLKVKEEEANIKADIVNIKTDVVTIKTGVAVIKTDVAVIKPIVADLQNEINKTEEQLESYIKDLEKIEEDVESLKKLLTAIENLKAECKRLSKEITTNSSNNDNKFKEQADKQNQLEEALKKCNQLEEVLKKLRADPQDIFDLLDKQDKINQDLEERISKLYQNDDIFENESRKFAESIKLLTEHIKDLDEKIFPLFIEHRYYEEEEQLLKELFKNSKTRDYYIYLRTLIVSSYIGSAAVISGIAQISKNPNIIDAITAGISAAEAAPMLGKKIAKSLAVVLKYVPVVSGAGAFLSKVVDKLNERRQNQKMYNIIDILQTSEIAELIAKKLALKFVVERKNELEKQREEKEEASVIQKALSVAQEMSSKFSATPANTAAEDMAERDSYKIIKMLMKLNFPESVISESDKKEYARKVATIIFEEFNFVDDKTKTVTSNGNPNKQSQMIAESIVNKLLNNNKPKDATVEPYQFKVLDKQNELTSLIANAVSDEKIDSDNKPDIIEKIANSLSYNIKRHGCSKSGLHFGLKNEVHNIYHKIKRICVSVLANQNQGTTNQLPNTLISSPSTETGMSIQQ